jgi:hypothetical protein
VWAYFKQNAPGTFTKALWILFEKGMIALLIIFATVAYGAQTERIKRSDTQTLALAKVATDAASDQYANLLHHESMDVGINSGMLLRLHAGASTKDVTQWAIEEEAKSSAANSAPGNLLWLDLSIRPGLLEFATELDTLDKILIARVQCVGESSDTQHALRCFDSKDYGEVFAQLSAAGERAACLARKYVLKATTRPEVGLSIPRPDRELPSLTDDEIRACDVTP